MEERDKDAIQSNYKSLVEEVNLYEILPHLISNKVFSPKQTEQYRNENRTERDRKRDLFLHIQRRGPTAFENLIKSLDAIGDYRHRKLSFQLQGKEIEKIQEEEFSYNENENQNQNQNRENNNLWHNPMEEPRGARPCRLPENQRPAHIRQLSHELPNAYINLGTEPLQVRVKCSEEFLDARHESNVPVYPMRSKNRGIFLCINNIEFGTINQSRAGAEVDEENLKKLFRDMGFQIEAHRNQSKLDTINTIHNFVDNFERLRKVDCVIVVVMSHGDEGHTKESSHIVTSDEQKIEVSWILEQFNNRHCPALISKPKIFLFQICRGDNLHPGVRIQPHESVSRPLPQPRITSDGAFMNTSRIVRDAEDMLIAFSTLPGDRSYRDTQLGTWYMQGICKIFMDHAHNIDIENLLRMVDFDIRQLRSSDGNMQTSSFENRGFHMCYLHPGIYEDPDTKTIKRFFS